MAVPYTFANATVSIPLSQLDSNFATAITLGNTAIQLGNTVTTLNNMTLANVTVSSGNATFTTANVTNMSSGNVTITGGTIANVTISGSGSNITATNINASNVTVSTDLTISGGTANGVAYLNGSKVLTTGSALTFDGTTLTGTQSTASQISLNNVSGNYLFFTAAGGAAYIDNRIPSDLNFRGGGNFVWGVYGGSEQMRLTSTGLGIGTSSPIYKLDVVQNGGSNVGVSASDGTRRVLLTASRGSTGEAAVGTTNNYGFAFETNATQRMYLDTSGNLGLGVTPSAWTGLGGPALQLGGPSGNIAANASYLNITSNAYYASGYKYIGSNYATNYAQENGKHAWYTAPSGTAGNAITFTQAMTLDASGNLGVGVTTIASASAARRALQISNGTSGGIIYLSNDGTESNNPRIFGSGSTQYDLGFAAGSSTGIINWYTNGAERMRIDSNGNVGIGTSSPGSRLTVAGVSSIYTSSNSNTGSGYVFSITGANNKTSSSDNSQFVLFSNDALASNPLSLVLSTVGNATVANGYAYLQTSEYGTGNWRSLALQPFGGNVGIGTSSPSTLLHLAASGPTLRVDGTPAGNSGAKLQLLGWANTATNWQLDVASIGGAGLEFVPSTAAGGSTFTTPAFTMYNNGVLAVTSGVQFPATQSASADANTLDDYEEGTWTPNLIGSGGGSPTVTGANGTYVKVGRMVTVGCFLNFSKNTLSGDLSVNNLPFTVSNDISCGPYAWANWYLPGGTALIHVAAIATQNTTTTRLCKITAANIDATASNLGVTELGSGNQNLSFYFTYFTAT